MKSVGVLILSPSGHSYGTRLAIASHYKLLCANINLPPAGVVSCKMATIASPGRVRSATTHHAVARIVIDNEERFLFIFINR